MGDRESQSETVKCSTAKIRTEFALKCPQDVYQLQVLAKAEVSIPAKKAIFSVLYYWKGREEQTL